MYPLATLKAACVEALEAIDKNHEWQESYCASVDPRSLLALTQQLETIDHPVTVNGNVTLTMDADKVGQ